MITIFSFQGSFFLAGYLWEQANLFFFLSFCFFFLVLGIATTPLLCVLMIPLGPNRDGILFIFTLLLLLSLSQEDDGKSWRWAQGIEIQINKYVVCCLIPLRAFFLDSFFGGCLIYSRSS